MNRQAFVLLAVAALFLLLAGPTSPARAQDDVIVLEQTDVFGPLSRAPVTFNHEAHVEAMDDECGGCHHVYDDDEGKLVPADGDESTCTDCHGAKKDGSVPALREAYHGNCTGCHRKMAKEHKKTGPVTCGECHTKP